MKKKVYRWQPELSTTIIYWSCTLAILLFSLILMLEYTQPYITSNLVLVVFFIFFSLGLNRYFILNSTELKIHALLPFNQKRIPLAEISTIRVGSRTIEIFSSRFKEGSQMFMIGKKSRTLFISELKHHSEYTGTIVEGTSVKMEK